MLITYTKVDSTPSMFKDQAPYVLGLAEFPDGPKVFAWIDRTIPEDQITVGMKLKLDPTKLTNGNLCYIFTRPNVT